LIQILVLADQYLPGYKAGGPIRSLANLIESLGAEFSFKVVTQDRDSGDEAPYRNVPVNSWQAVGRARVLYLSPDRLSAPHLLKIFRQTDYDVLYLNSFFSPVFTITPVSMRRLGLAPRSPLIVAPRGEFSPSALQLKKTKKRLYLATAKALGLYRGVLWQASSSHEERDIRDWFGSRCSVLIAPNLGEANGKAVPHTSTRPIKQPGRLRIVCISRISRMKNLSMAFRVLHRVAGSIEFNIYGPLSDPVYWSECEREMASLPSNVRVRFHGPIDHQQVQEVISQHHLFLMPTLGENFGYAILESFLAGCPALISDRTPWRDLDQKKVGWDLPLDRPDLFEAVINECVNMDEGLWNIWSMSAHEFGAAHATSLQVLQQNRALFHSAVGGQAKLT